MWGNLAVSGTGLWDLCVEMFHGDESDCLCGSILYGGGETCVAWSWRATLPPQPKASRLHPQWPAAAPRAASILVVSAVKAACYVLLPVLVWVPMMPWHQDSRGWPGCRLSGSLPAAAHPPAGVRNTLPAGIFRSIFFKVHLVVESKNQLNFKSERDLKKKLNYEQLLWLDPQVHQNTRLPIFWWWVHLSSNLGRYPWCSVVQEYCAVCRQHYFILT